MSRNFFITATITLVLLAISAAAFAQYQQPTPGEEEVGVKPAPSYPEPRSSAMRMADLVVFAGGLALGAFLIVRLQSRRGMLALLGVSLIYFGFWRNGCVCPIGAIQNVALSLSDSSYTISIYITIIFLLPIGAALLFGRIFCGSICPLGALQEWINPTKYHLHIPRRLDIWLGHLRWLYLAVALWMAVGGMMFFSLDLRTAPRFIICMTDPFVNIFRAVNLKAIDSSDAELFIIPKAIIGWTLTIGILLLSVVIIRPYCRWICPYGAILGTCSRAARWPVRLSPRLCPDCELCEPACPVNAIRRGVIDQTRCIACGRCHAACPVKRYELGLPAAAPVAEQTEPAPHVYSAPQRNAIETQKLERIADTPDLSYLDDAIKNAADQGEGALRILMAIQQAHGYLPAAALEAVAEKTPYSTAQLLEISSFYNMFRHEPVGEHIVSVCHGTACHVAGAGMVTDSLRRHLNIAEGRETDPTRKFTVEKISCLGCCSLAPVMQVDGVTYGHLTGESACEIIDKIAKTKPSRKSQTTPNNVLIDKESDHNRCACDAAGKEDDE